MGEAARVPRSCSLGRPLRSVHGGLALPRRASSSPVWDPAHQWRARKVDPSSEHMVVAGKGGGGSQDSPVPESRRTQEPSVSLALGFPNFQIGRWHLGMPTVPASLNMRAPTDMPGTGPRGSAYTPPPQMEAPLQRHSGSTDIHRTQLGLALLSWTLLSSTTRWALGGGGVPWAPG